MTPDTAAAIRFLQRYSPTELWCLTAISVDKKQLVTATFDPATELEKAADWINEFNGKRNLYFSVNPVRERLSKKASREDIKELRAFHVDLDCRAREDINTERTRIKNKLTTQLPEGVPQPSIVIDSGGGFWGIWLLKEPVELNGSVEAAEEAKRWNQQLETVFQADHCHNIDRIARLPGTINIPDKNKQAAGRQTALAKVISFSSVTYEASQFIKAPKVSTGASFATREDAIKLPSGNVERLASIDDLDQWKVPERVKLIIIQGNMGDLEAPKLGDNSRSGWLFDCLCQLYRAGVPDEKIYAIITDPTYAISASVLDKAPNVDSYARRQMARAKEHSEDPDLLQLNDKHAVIENLDGKCVVIEEMYDNEFNRTKIVPQTFEAFRNRYMHRGKSLPGAKGLIEIPLGKWWLTHSKRRQYNTMLFAPGKDVPGIYNLWQGFACPARPGDCSLFLEHLKVNICRGEEEKFNYLMGWMARAVQQPDRPGEVAIVLRGHQGTGKSFFAKQFGALFGRHFLQIADPKHLVGSFNKHLQDCLVLFGDEAFYAGDKKHESVLKMLITEDTLTVEKKGVDAEASNNYLHVILASNSQWVVPAGAFERRFLVLDVADDKRQNADYFRTIDKQMKNGGREALLYTLMNYDLKGFSVHKVPKTKALTEQKLLSLSGPAEWLLYKLREGTNCGDRWERTVRTTVFHREFANYMRAFNLGERASATKLGLLLRKYIPGVVTQQISATYEDYDEYGRPVTKRGRPPHYVFPSLEDCRKSFEEAFGGEIDWQEIDTSPVPPESTPF